MPKDEFDFEDPFELNGMAFLSHEDTTQEMAECFIEEFMRMGYTHQHVLGLFRNPHYLGPHMAFTKHGEPFISNLIADVFARWGRVANRPEIGGRNDEGPEAFEAGLVGQTPVAPASILDAADAPTDPMGAPVPQINQ